MNFVFAFVRAGSSKSCTSQCSLVQNAGFTLSLFAKHVAGFSPSKAWATEENHSGRAASGLRLASDGWIGDRLEVDGLAAGPAPVTPPEGTLVRTEMPYSGKQAFIRKITAASSEL